MVRKLARLVGLAAIALGLFAGCTMVPEQGNAIIGSIFIDSSVGDAGWVVYGGTEYHVLVYERSELIDPPDPTVDVIDSDTVNNLIPVGHLRGTFPSTTMPGPDWYFATNYIIFDVPAGEYFVFVWVDRDDDGFYNPEFDPVGFYEANATGASIQYEPPWPNVVVPAIGIVDIDVWCGRVPPPEV